MSEGHQTQDFGGRGRDVSMSTATPVPTLPGGPGMKGQGLAVSTPFTGVRTHLGRVRREVQYQDLSPVAPQSDTQLSGEVTETPSWVHHGQLRVFAISLMYQDLPSSTVLEHPPQRRDDFYSCRLTSVAMSSLS